MSVPELANPRRCLAQLREGREPEPDVQWAGPGDPLPEGQLDELRRSLQDVKSDVEGSGAPKHEFDTLAAPVLHQALNISRAEASRGGFWAYLCVLKVPEVVGWRWGDGSLESVEDNGRLFGGRRNALQRLWFRAEALHQEGGAAPYPLLDRPIEDFWQQIYERPSLSVDETLFRELVAYWYGDDVAREPKRERYRLFLQALRYLRPRRQFEALTRQQLWSCFEEAEDMAGSEWFRELAL